MMELVLSKTETITKEAEEIKDGRGIGRATSGNEFKYPSLPPSLPQALAFAGIDNSPEALRDHILALVLILAASYVVTYLGLTVRARYFTSI